MTSLSLFRAAGVFISLLILLLLIQSSTARSQSGPSDDPMRKLLTERRFGECDEYTFIGRRLIPRLLSDPEARLVDQVTQYIKTIVKLTPLRPINSFAWRMQASILAIGVTPSGRKKCWALVAAVILPKCQWTLFPLTLAVQRRFP